jgi:hypothetical protein
VRHAAATKVGANNRNGIRRAGHRAGRAPAYLFSSLLKCGVCGASMSIIGGSEKWKTYGCPSRKEGGAAACSNALTVKLTVVEARLLHTIRTDLVDPEVLAEFRRRVTKAMNGRPARKLNPVLINGLREQIGHLTEAIACGALRSSPALADRLAHAERELAGELQAAQSWVQTGRVTNLPSKAEATYLGLVRELEIALRKDVHRALSILKRIVGDTIPVHPHASGKHLVARIGLDAREFAEAVVGAEFSDGATSVDQNIPVTTTLLPFEGTKGPAPAERLLPTPTNLGFDL